MRGSGRGALHAVHTPQRETGADTAIPAAFVQHVRPPPLRVMARCRLRRAVRLLEPLQLQSAGCPQASRGDACGAGALSARSHRRWRTLCLLCPQPHVRAPGWARPTGRSRPPQARSPQLTVALAVMRHVAAAWIVPSPRHSGVIGNNRVGPR